ncbi:hypothetical protein STRAU_6213 [Streptomyces aurantiacus JA 4570]|uniref:Uncharacterized protein n=1 Tax=Streptomyces aurantiacus JA 4570 TaxID=1286094 RepID=S3ZQR6_9ACTN|nr:hypothetical protein STRAU_6213 [Streptomyces aurantiacus JA 4570]
MRSSGSLCIRFVRCGERSASMFTTMSRGALQVVVPEQSIRPTTDGVRPPSCPPQVWLPLSTSVLLYCCDDH